MAALLAAWKVELHADARTDSELDAFVDALEAHDAQAKLERFTIDLAAAIAPRGQVRAQVKDI